MIYIIIYAIFFIVSFFPICLSAYEFISSQTDSLSSYYLALFNNISTTSSIYQLLLTLLLFIPLISSLIAFISLIVEFLQGNNNQAAQYSFGISTVCFAISGMIYASLTSTILPFGMIILAISLGIFITKLIFRYGLKGIKY